MRRVIIMGAGGRDFHDFNVVYRDDPGVEVVAFTATQIPGIDNRLYPAVLAGPRYPRGIRIHPEAELAGLIHETGADLVVFAYSDISHVDVMHRASMVLAAGADFVMLGPRSTMLESTLPVVAVCAVRTGAGKSQTSRRAARYFLDCGLRVALIRHPMPYGDLAEMRVQRFATLQDIDASHPTLEEREEYERPVEMGMVVYAGVDYAEILARAEAEADVLVWDGGNNDLPFIRPDLHVVVVDPLRAGDELAYHPGEANLRMAGVVVVNKVDSAGLAATQQVLQDVREVNPAATVIQAASPAVLEDPEALRGKRVLVVEDGPTLTHGGMAFGAGAVAAGAAGAELVDPREYAVGSIAETLAAHPRVRRVVPAMGYSPAQLWELEQTINRADCDAVVTGTPLDLGRLIHSRHPVHHVSYELQEIGRPTLADVLAPVAEEALRRRAPAVR